MRGPSLFGCLPVLTPHCLLQTFMKNSNAIGITSEPEVLPPPPPSEEVFPSEDEESTSSVMEPVALQRGLTLLKRRVNSQSIFNLPYSDLMLGKYEGGYKLWDCSVDLVETLRREIQDGQLSFRGKRVLELGCGHGLPGIFACLKGASSVHFQDFNAEVLRNVTTKNVQANLDQARKGLIRVNSVSSGLVRVNSGLLRANSIGSNAEMATSHKGLIAEPDVHYYAGDWSDVHNVLSAVRVSPGTTDIGDEGAFNFMFTESELYEPVQETEIRSGGLTRTGSRNRLARKLSGSQACDRGHTNTTQEGGYDIILMSETVYSLTSLPKLYELIKKCTRPPYGVVYLAAKKHYVGVGGGTRQFKRLVEEDEYGPMAAHLVADFADNSSNVREVWKFFFSYEVHCCQWLQFWK
uniref:protein-histidine N-methyltransferase n=1 Tax=Physcomitrium patens TaxID=3218 RepID=A0A7I4EGT9_PHYPA